MAAQQVTVANLLSHRVGLRHNAYDRDLEANVRLRDADPQAGLCPDGMRTRAPATGYQNIAFSLIGDVIQNARECPTASRGENASFVRWA
jgi:beta-lactamase class C